MSVVTVHGDQRWLSGPPFSGARSRFATRTPGAVEHQAAFLGDNARRKENSMSLPVTGYRLRFAPATREGEIVLYLIDTDGGPKTEFLRGLEPAEFAALAAILTSDKDHRLFWDGTTIDAGPEQT
jgi:hypothetical protein